jgi:hypothetical protein
VIGKKHLRSCVGEGRTAGPSAPLRSGRDDKGWGSASRRNWLVAERITGPSLQLGRKAFSSAALCRGPRLTPEATIEGAVLDGFCNVAYRDARLGIKVCDGASDLQYPVVGAGAQALLLHGALKQALRLR